MRLVGGPNDFEGRVEVCLGGVWRRWCSSANVDNEAAVVCRQLGHGRGGQYDIEMNDLRIPVHVSQVLEC